jgi:WD40 repeat protein
VNAFVYSSKHRFIASCGEERHIIMWDPFTLKALQYLKGHNTSVQDLAINEERSHLLSLGTDKVVKVWDTKTYLLIQTIIDRTQYRPNDELNCLLFDEVSKSILVGSRKINFWPFKT